MAEIEEQTGISNTKTKQGRVYFQDPSSRTGSKNIGLFSGPVLKIDRIYWQSLFSEPVLKIDQYFLEQVLEEGC